VHDDDGSIAAMSDDDFDDDGAHVVDNFDDSSVDDGAHLSRNKTADLALLKDSSQGSTKKNLGLKRLQTTVRDETQGKVVGRRHLVSPALRELLTRLLNRDEKTRMTATEAMQHWWVVSAASHTLPLPQSVQASLQALSSKKSLEQSIHALMSRLSADGKVVGSANALVTFICALCTLRAQISRSI
jgi:serine/threonine protein kinase